MHNFTGSCHVNFDLDVGSVCSICFFITGSDVFFICGQNCTLEWFSEAGSAPIRSAVKFYFDIDVRIFFQLLQKYFFDRPQKKSSKKMKIFKISKNFKIFKEKLMILKFSIFEILFFSLDFFSTFFWSIEKNIFWRSWEKNPDINIEVKCHCGSNGSTPSLWKPL